MNSASEPPTISSSMQTLRAHQKPALGAPLYSRFLNRPAGRFIAACAYRLGLNPNQVTFISAAWSALAIGLIQLPISPWSGAAVALFLMLGYAFDSADGQLARLTSGGSSAGEWLDHVVDAIKIGALHASVLISWYRHHTWPEGSPWLVVPVLFGVAAYVYFIAYLLGDLLRRAAVAQGSAQPSPRRTHDSWVRALAVLPTDYGVHCLLFFCWGWPLIFGRAYACCAVGVSLYVLLGLPVWFAAMKNLGR